MPLADMLSAMRGIILDGLPLPPTEEQRTAFLCHKFPTLSPLEAQDLARVDPEKFGIYTGTIFRGEAGLLRRLFPMSFLLLQTNWSECFGKEFNSFSFTRELHRCHPWKSYATVGFADSFVTYVTCDLLPVTQLVPALPEIAQFEFASLRILRAIGEVYAKTVPLEALPTFTVEELLGLDLRQQSSAELLALSFNCIEARAHYQQTHTLEQFTLKQNTTFALGSRDSENDLHWTKLPEAVYRMLSATPRMDSISVEDFAVASLEEVNADSEEEKFQVFFDLLITLLKRGAIVIEDSR